MSETILEENEEILPDTWVLAKIDDIADVIRGSSPRPKGDPRYFGGNIPWIMISDISKEKGKFVTQTKDHVTEEGAKRSRLLKKGSLILSNSGTVCVPKILGVDGCIHDGFVTFPMLENHIEILYAYYWFEYIRPKIIQENKQGITQVNLNINIVKNIDIPLPPLNEQKRIVEKIEESFSKLDELQEIIKNCHVKTTSLSQKVIDDYVSINKSKSIECQLGDISEIKGGVAVGRKIKGKTIRLPYLRVANVQDGYLDLNHIKNIDILESELDRWLLHSGDILVTEGGDRDKLGRGTVWKENIPNCIHQNHIFRIRLDQSRFLPEYVSMILRSTTGKRYFQHKGKQSVNLASINKTQLSTFKFFCPNYNSQKSRYLMIQKFLDYLANLEKSCQLLLQLLNSLKKSILKQAFEGKLISQNPNDEPAEILLEKIKREKQLTISITNSRKKRNGT